MIKLLFVLSLGLFFLYPSATCNAQANQTVTNGESTTAINFTGATCTYKWVNSNPSIGLPASGTGNIPSFTAMNTGNSPVVATIKATPVGSGFAYIVNAESNNVSVINTATSKVVALIPVGKKPNSVCVDPNYDEVYVVNNAANTISVINTLTNMVKTIIPVGPLPWSVTVSPDGSRAYVADGGGNSVQVINTTTNTVINTIPAGNNPNAIAVSPDGNTLYVNNSNHVTVIDAKTGKAIANIAVGSAPQAILITPDGSTVYEANYASNDVYAINTATNTISAIIPVGSNPGGGSMSPDGSVVYIANESSNSVSVISTTTNKVTATIPVGAQPWGVSVRPDGSQVYVANSGSNSISIVDPATNKIISDIAVGTAPYSFGSFFTGGMGCSELLEFTITVNPGSAPTITNGPVTGTISACAGTASASPDIQQFTVSGKNLTGNIKAASPTGFEVSLSALSGYGSSVTIPQTSGTVSSVLVYVRSAASASTGKISGNVILASSGAANVKVAITGTVNALPTIDPIANQTVTNGKATAAVNFTGTGNSFTWVNDTPGIGLAASGTGDIPSFVAVNTGSSPIIATITVTPTSASYIYIVNSYNNTLEVINTTTGKITAIIPTGKYPIGVSVSPDGKTVYVSNLDPGNPGSVSVISTLTNKVTATISVGLNPWGIVTSPDGKWVYVANENSGTISVISTATNAVFTSIPIQQGAVGLAISPDGSRLYVAASHVNAGVTQSNVIIINTLNNTVLTSIPVGGSIWTLAVSPDGRRVYTANAGSNSSQVINTSTNTVIADIPLVNFPDGAVVSPDGTRVYIANNYGNAISVIDAATNKAIATIADGQNPEGLSISPDGKYLYVVNTNSNNVAVFDTQTNTKITSLSIGQSGDTQTLGNFFLQGTGCTGVPVTFTITVNPLPQILAADQPAAVNTIYGTPSSSSSFTVSGTNMTSGILVTPPNGFEVSADGTTFSNTVSVGSAGAIAPTEVYIRLTAATPAGPHSGNIVLSSTGAANVTVEMPNSTVNPAPLTITANNVNKVAGTAIIGGPGSTAFTSTGLQNSETIGSVTISYGQGAAAGAATGTYNASVTASAATGGTFLASNYEITYISADIIVIAAPVSAITANGILLPLSTIYGTPSSTTSFTVSGANLTSGILITPPAGFEISTDGTTFSSTVTVGTTGNITATSIYLRLAATTHVGNYSDNIVLSSTGVSDVNVKMPLSTVSPAVLTISADSKSKSYGTDNPALTVTYSGFQNGDGPAQLTVQPSVSTIATTLSPAGGYPITVSGAVATDYSFLYVAGTLTISPVLSAATVPNVFTPNNDGINDTWDIRYLDTYVTCTVDIFNRYGQKIFSSIGYGTPWDGKYHGYNVPSGTYYYIIDLNNNQHAVLSGWVAIIR